MRPHAAEDTTADHISCEREMRVARCIFVLQGGVGSVLPHVAEVNEGAAVH